MKIKAEDIVVKEKESGITEEFLVFVKEKVVDAFSHKKTIIDICTFMKDSVRCEEGGDWICSFIPVDSIACFSFFYKERKCLKLTLERDGFKY